MPERLVDALRGPGIASDRWFHRVMNPDQKKLEDLQTRLDEAESRLRKFSYPDFRRGLKAGLIVGTFFGVCTFMLSRADVSLLFYRPWWRHLEFALGALVFFTIATGIIIAFRPVSECSRGKRRRRFP